MKAAVIFYTDVTLLHHVREITMLHPIGMFAEQRQTQSDSVQLSDHYTIYLSASRGYTNLVFHPSIKHDSHQPRQPARVRR